MNNSPVAMTYVADLHTRDRTRQQFAHDASAGTRVRVARGVYTTATQWDSLHGTDRYLAVIHAIANTRRTSPIISHWSAAALHGLPMIGAWPSTVHITVPPASGSRSRHQVTRHSLSLDDDEVVEISGFRVTSLARTIIDIAACGKFSSAVTMADFALHVDRFERRQPGCTRDELARQWQRGMPFSGFARAREVVDFATELSDSALESLSRSNMELIGFPRPRLQVPFFDHRGLIGYGDFFWPEFSLIGEADGDLKYLDPAFRNSRSAEQVLLAQSKRENRLRALGFRVARWDWDTAVSLPALRDHLRAAGLPARIR